MDLLKQGLKLTVFISRLDGNSCLSRSRYDDLFTDRMAGDVFHVQTSETSFCEEGGIEESSVDLPHASLYIPSDGLGAQMRIVESYLVGTAPA